MEAYINNNKVLNHGSDLIKKGNYEGALKHYNSALNYDPINAWFGKGLLYVDLGDEKKALDFFNRALTNNTFVPALIERGRLFRRIKRPESALKSFNRALELYPDNALILYEKADLLIELQNYEEASGLLEKIISSNPEFFHAWHDKGDIFSFQYKDNDAIESYYTALNLKPDYLPSWVGLGLSYNNLGQFEDSINCYNKAIEINPSYSFSYLALADAYKRLDDYETAIYYIDNALEKNDKFLEAWFEKGIILTHLGDLEDGLTCLDKICINKPEYAYVWYSIGLILKMHGQYPESLKYFKKTLELDENFLPAWKSIEKVLFITGQTDKAIKCHDFIEHDLSDLKIVGNVIENLDNYMPDYKKLYFNSEPKRVDLPEIEDETTLEKRKQEQLNIMDTLDEERKKPFKPEFTVRKRVSVFGALSLVFSLHSIIYAMIYGPQFFIISIISLLIGYKILTLGQNKYYSFNYHRKVFAYTGVFYFISCIIFSFMTYQLFRSDPVNFIQKTLALFSRHGISYYSSTELFNQVMLLIMIWCSIIMTISSEFIAAYPNVVFKYPAGTEPTLYS